MANDSGVILPTRVGPTLGGIEITGAIRQVHTRSARISEHPIEDGSVIADHRQRDPFVLELDTCVISDILHKQASEAIGFDDTDDEGASQEARKKYLALLDFDARNIPIDVVTGLDVYQDMLFEHLSVTRDASTGNAISFSATLRQAQFASSRTVEVATNTGDRKVRPAEDKGTKSTDDTDVDPEMSSSMLENTFGGSADSWRNAFGPDAPSNNSGVTGAARNPLRSAGGFIGQSLGF